LNWDFFFSKTYFSEFMETAQGGNIQCTGKCASFGNVKTVDIAAMIMKTQA